MAAAPDAVVGSSQAEASSIESKRIWDPRPGSRPAVGDWVGPGVQVPDGMIVGKATVAVGLDGTADGGGVWAIPG
jgi:hypothetical protein